jgi:GT2 family glycosyltransferase
LRKQISEGIFDKMVSIITLSYGKYEQTYEAIKSIVDTVKIPFELILFDNGSDNKTVTFLKTKIATQFPFVKLIFNKTNLGPAEGRTKGEYYIIFDNDEVAQPGWIEELLVRGEISHDIGAVLPRVFFPDDKLQFSGGGIRSIDENLIDLFLYDNGKSRFDPSTAQFRECEWVPIGATLFKINPSMYLHRGYQNLFEDAGVSFALRKQGYRLVNAPGAHILHNHFMFRDKFSMKKKYLEDRYNPDGMLRAIASFYAENNLIIYDEYAWKENGIGKLSPEELKRKLVEVYNELTNVQKVRCSPYFSIDT